MEHTPLNESEKEFVSYPTNKVIGIIDTPTDAQGALDALTTAGFAKDEIDVLCGKEGARRLDLLAKSMDC